MTNKTITLSRELGSDPITHMAGLLELVVNPRSYPIDTLHAQIRSTLELVHAALADSVPPTCGKCGKPTACGKMICEECCYEPMPAPPAGGAPNLNRTQEQWRLVDAKLCAKQNSEAANEFLIRDAQYDIAILGGYVIRLQAEVERQKARDLGVKLEVFEVVCKERDALQAELTKARELLSVSRSIVAANNTSNMSSELLKAIDDFRSNQSAPADKAPPLIQALHANGDRIAMEATIAQQAQRIADLEADKGQGEPVAWRGLNAYGEVVTEWIDGIPPERMTDLCGNAASFDKIERAYAEQPAPVAVVMPPAQCRQRIAAEGKPYPRSSCAVCGQFSPKSRECDALIEASSGKQK